MKITPWGAEVDRNLFATSEADRTKFASYGCEAHSLTGDPLFVNAASGDFRVRAGSPAFQLGFANFPMDQFGVYSPRLKAIARAPKIPTLDEIATLNMSIAQTNWLGATIRELTMGEYSAMGMSMESGGIRLADAPVSSGAFKAGLRSGDFVMKVNGRVIPCLANFLLTLPGTGGGPNPKLEVIRNRQRMTLEADF